MWLGNYPTKNVCRSGQKYTAKQSDFLMNFGYWYRSRARIAHIIRFTSTNIEIAKAFSITRKLCVMNVNRPSLKKCHLFCIRKNKAHGCKCWTYLIKMEEVFPVIWWSYRIVRDGQWIAWQRLTVGLFIAMTWLGVLLTSDLTKKTSRAWPGHRFAPALVRVGMLVDLHTKGDLGIARSAWGRNILGHYLFSIRRREISYFGGKEKISQALMLSQRSHKPPVHW